MQAFPRLSTAALLAAFIAAPAAAQNEVNSTGATLFSGFFQTQAQGGDSIDADGDGQTTDLVAGEFDGLLGDLFNVQSRGIGSGNGFQELINYGRANNGPSARGWSTGDFDSNDFEVRNGFSANPSGNFTGPVAFDFAAVDVPSSFFVTNTAGNGAFDRGPFVSSGTTLAPAGGYGNAPIVSSPNAVQPGSTLARGGRDNDLASLTPAGDGTGAGVTLNTDIGTPDRQTLFDTQIAWTPIAGIANFGAQIDSNGAASGGEGEIGKTTYQHALATGRLETGENLLISTRDSGSGTRNGFSNSVGVDPSWANGDNVGQKTGSGDSASERLGPDFTPSNKGGSSRMEGTVTNAIPAVGYTGLADGLNSSSRAFDDAAGGRYQILAIGNDTDAAWDGSSYVFPTFNRSAGDATGNNVIFNDDPNTGYQVGGSQTFVTEGDPRAGTIIYDSVANTARFDDGSALGVNEQVVSAGTGPNDGNADVYLANPLAALYLRNIVESQAVAINDPLNDGTVGTPGDFLATSFALVPAVERLPDPTNPDVFIANPDFSATLNSTLANNPDQLPADVVVTGYGPTASNGDRYGRYGDRTAGVTYTDGTGSDDYVTNAGTVIVDGSDKVAGNAVADRNAIGGDFDGDFDRDVSDIDDMVFAYENSGARGATSFVDAAGNTIVSRDGALAASDPNASLEVIGDFNADGNFDLEDVRYGADGLFNRGRTGDRLDRAANYIEIDNASTSGNLFGTDLATGKAYAAGDSRGDVAGRQIEFDGSFVDADAAGCAPTGADGRVDADDIDFVYDNFVGLDQDGTGAVEWANLDEAANSVRSGGRRVDLSADMNGDLAIGQTDVDTLVRGVLGTEHGDANLDGDVDVFEFGGGGDVQIVNGNLGLTSDVGWADGDFNGDDDVDVFQFDGRGDVQLLNGNLGFGTGAAAAAAMMATAAEASTAAVAAGTVEATYDITTGEVVVEIGSNVGVLGFEALEGSLLPENLSDELSAAQATSSVIAFFDLSNGLPEGEFSLGAIIPAGTAASSIGFGFSPLGGDFVQSTLTVIPEPTTLAAAGLAGLALLRRRRVG